MTQDDKWRDIADRLARAIQRLSSLDGANWRDADQAWEEALHALAEWGRERADEGEEGEE